MRNLWECEHNVWHSAKPHNCDGCCNLRKVLHTRDIDNDKLMVSTTSKWRKIMFNMNK